MVSDTNRLNTRSHTGGLVWGYYPIELFIECKKQLNQASMKTLAELRGTAEWQAAEYMETRSEMLAANKIQAAVALHGVLEDWHADLDDDTVTDWYTGVSACSMAQAIMDNCPGIEAVVESGSVILISVRPGWTLVTEDELGVDEYLGD